MCGSQESKCLEKQLRMHEPIGISWMLGKILHELTFIQKSAGKG